MWYDLYAVCIVCMCGVCVVDERCTVFVPGVVCSLGWGRWCMCSVYDVCAWCDVYMYVRHIWYVCMVWYVCGCVGVVYVQCAWCVCAREACVCSHV